MSDTVLSVFFKVFFFSFFFLMWAIFKIFKEFVTILVLFHVLVSCGEVCGISVPFPGTEPTPPALEGKV